MTNWLLFAGAAMVCLASADFCLKMASARISGPLSALIYGLFAFLVALLWVLLARSGGAIFRFSWTGGLYSVLVGLAFGLVVVFMYQTFAAGAPISLVTPLVRTGGIILASLAGVLFLREGITSRYLLGFFLTLLGLYLLVTK